MEFIGFPKIARLSREVIITEKIDGTNGQIYIPKPDDFFMPNTIPFLIGSRTRWIAPENDNHGFAKWCCNNVEELLKLGPGRHVGEWWGRGINRGYGLKEKRFSLFNVLKWEKEELPKCVSLVPVLWRGIFNTDAVDMILGDLQFRTGSIAAPGYLNPEGVVVYHIAGNVAFKKTIRNDDGGKNKGE